MNVLELILAGAHFVDCRFSNYNLFKDKITALVANSNNDIEHIREHIIQNINTIKTNDIFNIYSAEELLFLNDVNIILEKYQKSSHNLFNESLDKYHAKFIRLLRQIGLEMKLPPIFMIDVFPAPYDKMPWSACAPDIEDYERYGITPGIYFKKDKVTPFQSPLVLAHELIHGAASNANPFLLARGLEEGLCDIIGSAYLCLSEFGYDLTFKMFEYKRLNYSNNQFQEIYYDFLKQAYYLLVNYGIDGLVFLIKKGREQIKEVENYLLQGHFNKINLPKGNHDIKLTNLISHICLTYGKNLCVSPLAVFIYDNISRNDTIDGFCNKYKIPRDEADKAVEELKSRVFLIVTKDNTIMYNEREHIKNSRYMRYELYESSSE